MKKPKRNERVLYICHYLTQWPNKLIKLAYFGEYLNAAKSSISEDINLVKEVFREHQLGEVATVAGASGGVIYHPAIPEEEQRTFLGQLVERLSEGKRILPGNYISVNDIIQDPYLLTTSAKFIATKYQKQDIDAVLTIETKGIGLATAVAHFLNVPYVTVRRDSTDTAGPTISVNYVSGSQQTVMKMELPKNSLKANDRVLIVDDFLRNGGTATGLRSLIEEFECEAAGMCVLVENTSKEQQRALEFEALISAEIVFNKESNHFDLSVKPGSLFNPAEKR